MADIELNALGIKSDALPDSWGVLLIDPTTGEESKQMTVAKFIELFMSKAWSNTILKGENGWCKFPNGLIIQWGILVLDANGSRAFTINFPISFATKDYKVIAHPTINTYDNNPDLVKRAVNYKLGFTSLNDSYSSMNGYIECENGYGSAVKWIAIGV